MTSRTALLTVGSTSFDELVCSFLSLDSVELLSTQHQCQHLLAQVGHSKLPPPLHPGLNTLSVSGATVTIDVVRFMGDIETRVSEATLVVSHAGQLALSPPSHRDD